MSLEMINAFLQNLSKLSGDFKITEEMIDATKTFVKQITKKSSKKESPKKDPNAPKRPTNAYMIFSIEERQKIKEDSGIEDSKELIKEIASRWNEEKKKESKVFKKYSNKLQEAKKKYESEMESYIPDPSFESLKKEKKEKESDSPKKPINAYMIFAKEERQKIKDSSSKDGIELTKEIGFKWNEEKKKDSEIYKKYTSMFEEEKEKYDKEMKSLNEEKESSPLKKKEKASSPPSPPLNLSPKQVPSAPKKGKKAE